jgi:dipeptidyl aminopeptidase/acylaminoacyl peptidase
VVRITGEAAGGSHEGVSVCGGVAVGVRSRLTHPPEPFVVRLAEGSEPRLLATLSGFTEAEANAIAGVESMTVEGDGGVPVQSFVVTPKAGAGRRAGLVWIHGGPMGAWGDGWHWRWNPIVGAAQGYVIALPNPRGSTGFGQEFVEGIWGNVWGAACYRDLLAVADRFCARADVDPERVAAMGGSFGGYMTNWIGGNTDRFRALVTHASVYSMSAFHGVTDSPAYWAYAMGGAPYGRQDYDVYSPHARIDRWKTPTLVIHGEKDYRVPVSEGLALFEGLQHHGVDSELLIFPDENHWILKPRNVVAWYDAVFSFLGKHLSP